MTPKIGKKNKALELLLNKTHVDQEQYAIELIECFATEFAAFIKMDISYSLEFVRSYDVRIREKIGKNAKVLSRLTKKWLDAAKESDGSDGKGGKGGESGGAHGDEVFLTLWIFTGVESSFVKEVQAELRAFIEANEVYKGLNTKLLEKMPREFNGVKDSPKSVYK